MRKIDVLFYVSIGTMMLISLSNFIIKFIIGDCNSKYMIDTNYDKQTNDTNISFYNTIFIASFVFSLVNILFYMFCIVIKIKLRSYARTNFLSGMIFICLVWFMNISWIFFESLIVANIRADKCYLHVANIIEPSLAFIYGSIFAMAYTFIVKISEEYTLVTGIMYG